MSPDCSPVFFWVNGREVYECDGIKQWRCPHCHWWRPWEEKKCPVCDTPRDGGESE